MSQSGRGLVCQSNWSSLTSVTPYSCLNLRCLSVCCVNNWVQIAYLKLSMWQCIEAEAVSCASGAGSGSDGPVRTTAVAEVETDDVDLAEAVFQCEAASDLTSAQKNSVWSVLLSETG